MLHWKNDNDVTYMFAPLDPETGYIAVRWIGDREIVVRRRIYNTQICIGPAWVKTYAETW